MQLDEGHGQGCDLRGLPWMMLRDGMVKVT